jgi:HAD superfamily hydrolase (TIGR01490 family)
MTERVAAFFDMDRTVVRSNTGPLYIAYAYRHGWLRKRHVAIGAWWTLLYKLTVLDTASAVRKATETMAGVDETELTAFCRRWVAEQVVPEISRSARRIIELHRRRGDVLVLLTASSPYAAEPVAEHLEMDHVLCTRVEVTAGQLTGLPIEPPCIGNGKVVWAEELADKLDICLSRSTFYTDSIQDMPMLLRVGDPVIVNPDFRLDRLARKRGWRVERWQ